MEEMLKEVQEGLENGTLSKEEAKIILEDIQRTLEIEDAAQNIALKGQMLKTVSNLLSLV